jgi:hypothetical protein
MNSGSAQPPHWPSLLLAFSLLLLLSLHTFTGPTGTHACRQHAQLAPPRRNAVLAMSRGADFHGAYRFVRSLRTHSPATDIVVFTDAASLAGNLALQAMYDMFGVTLVLVTEDSIPPEARGFSPSGVRWLVFCSWMRAHAAAVAAGTAQPYGTLMFSDARDVLFQADPFVMLERADGLGGGRGFYAFLESHEMIGDSEWNWKWVADCFGNAGLAEVQAFPVSCSGSSMGSWDDAFAYVEIMCA